VPWSYREAAVSTDGNPVGPGPFARSRVLHRYRALAIVRRRCGRVVIIVRDLDYAVARVPERELGLGLDETLLETVRQNVELGRELVAPELVLDDGREVAKAFADFILDIVRKLREVSELPLGFLES
jgi:hypothetical protein